MFVQYSPVTWYHYITFMDYGCTKALQEHRLQDREHEVAECIMSLASTMESLTCTISCQQAAKMHFYLHSYLSSGKSSQSRHLDLGTSQRLSGIFNLLSFSNNNLQSQIFNIYAENSFAFKSHLFNVHSHIDS